MWSLKDKIVFVTGGTGSLGRMLVTTLLNNANRVKKIIVFSRDELKQSEMSALLNNYVVTGQLQFILGDIRDKDALNKAMKNVDVVFHTSALKHVPLTENNPRECIKTNVIGTLNIIDVCIENQVKRVIALSTDKAASPESVYGASKLISDKLFIDANKYNITNFSVVRFGNVLGSRGSVLPLFIEQTKNNKLTITHPEMTRFCITISQAIEVLIFSCEHCFGGEIIIPKSPSFKIELLAEIIGTNCEKIYTGIRVGEKLHEDMITQDDARFLWETKDYFILITSKNSDEVINYWTTKFKAKKSNLTFSLRSDNNPVFLTKEELTSLIYKNNIYNFLS